MALRLSERLFMLLVHASDLTGDDAGASVHAEALARDGTRLSPCTQVR